MGFLSMWQWIYLVTEESGIGCTHSLNVSANAGSYLTSASNTRLPRPIAKGLWGSDSIHWFDESCVLKITVRGSRALDQRPGLRFPASVS